MSQRTFQAMLGRMVVDLEFRRCVREQGDAALDADLTPLERERLLAAAADRGMDATRMVHKDFRLSKLYYMLPLTRFLLGSERLSREVSAFWSRNLPVSHYFIQESIDFCEHLQRRLLSGGLRVKYLREIVAYERAELELKLPRPGNDAPPPPQLVHFRYDPTILFTQLTQRRRPRAVPRLDCALRATLNPDDGQIQWQLHEGHPDAKAKAPSKAAPRTRKAKALRAHR